MSDDFAVIGWDLSLTASGLTLPDGQCFTIRPKLKGDRRLGEIREVADRYIRHAVMSRTGPAATNRWLSVIETPSNIDRGGWDTTCAILFAHAIVRDVLADYGIPHVYIHNKTLKKYTTGNGNAGKTEMIAFANEYRAECLRIHPPTGETAPAFPEPITDDNQADAWMLWAAGRHYFGKPVHPELMLSRDVLFGPHAKTRWPEPGEVRAAPNRTT